MAGKYPNVPITQTPDMPRRFGQSINYLLNSALTNWLTAFQISTGLPNGSSVSTPLVSLTNDDAASAVGLIGGAQSLHFTNAGTNAIANSAYVVNNNATLSTHAWGFYGEAHKVTAAAGSVYGMELDPRATVPTIAPNPNQQGDVIGLQLGAGAGVSATGQFDCSAAIQIVDNPKRWKIGINILSTALNGPAIAMAKAHKVSWYDNSSNVVMSLDGQVMTVPELAAGSVSTPASGTQSLFIDTADHKLKRKDSSGTVTIIA
jgi:hypothetical protein